MSFQTSGGNVLWENNFLGKIGDHSSLLYCPAIEGVNGRIANRHFGTFAFTWRNLNGFQENKFLDSFHGLYLSWASIGFLVRISSVYQKDASEKEKYIYI